MNARDNAESSSRKFAEKIDRVLDLDDDRERGDGIDDLIQQLKRPSGLSEYHTSFLIGYLSYLHPRKHESAEIESAVWNSLRLASTAASEPDIAARAKLYLGHAHFDSQAFDEAARWLDSCEPNELPDYLRLKLFEMRLCCGIRRDGIEASVGRFSEFVNAARSVEPVDVWPENLARLLKEPNSGFSDSTIDLFRKLAADLDDAGNLGDWFGEIVSVWRSSRRSR